MNARSNKPVITYEWASQRMQYDPLTGIVLWKQCEVVGPGERRLVATKVGKQVGSIGRLGYREIQIKYRCYQVHRLVWLLHYGKWPQGEIDHINCIKHDNRIANLRDVDRCKNLQNVGLTAANTSGYKGVSRRKTGGKWTAEINYNRVHYHIGYYDELEDAVAAYREAAERLHGEYRRFV